MNVLVGSLVGLGLVVANGFFVAVEFALLAARRMRVEAMADEGRLGARAALAGMRSLNLQLAASQLGITIMSLLLGWLVEPVVGGAIERALGRTALPESFAAALGLALALSLVALVHMVLGEMVPKSVALAAPERTVVVLAPVHRLVALAVRPVVVALYATARAGTRLLGVDPTDELVEAHTVEELAVLLEAAHSGGELASAERDRLAGALGFLGRTCADVMTPRDQLVTVPVGATVAEAERIIVASGHSRVLVEAQNGAAVGFLHVKDLLDLPADRRDGPVPAPLVREAVAFGADEPLATVLRVVQSTRRHLAVVEDRTDPSQSLLVGLVTVEDLVEAIFGAIGDETDRVSDRSPGSASGSSPDGVAR